MALPKLIPEEHIRDLEAQRRGKLNKIIQNYDESLEAAWERKEEWLAVYARTLSPSIACDRTEISMNAYERWRKTCPRFCRALNRIIENAHDELMGSVIGRATGYLKPNAETESGYDEDGQGRPIRYNGSDTLARQLIAPAVESASPTEQPTKVLIEVGRFTGEGTPAVEDLRKRKLPAPEDEPPDAA